MDAARHYYSLA